jgi:dTDP-4-dehydrorhamnose 3,5-epimerase-like enzyme
LAAFELLHELGASVTSRKAAEEAAGSRCELIQFTFVEEPRGWLSAAEAFDQVPFEIKRVYWLSGVPPGGERAHHAHREQQELLVAARGGFTVHCDDGRVRSVYRLDSPACGLLLPEMVWHHLDEFSGEALCLVLASGLYDYDEYVHHYDEFREITASW